MGLGWGLHNSRALGGSGQGGLRAGLAPGHFSTRKGMGTSSHRSAGWVGNKRGSKERTGHIGD